jgi:hypothetical protein
MDPLTMAQCLHKQYEIQTSFYVLSWNMKVKQLTTQTGKISNAHRTLTGKVATCNTNLWDRSCDDVNSTEAS